MPKVACRLVKICWCRMSMLRNLKLLLMPCDDGTHERTHMDEEPPRADPA
jgi:hypothetical protein